MAIANRAFGIELESCFPMGANPTSFESIAAAVRGAGVECHVERYGHATPQRWKVVQDGSVSGGGELVSPILRGEDGIAEAVKAVRALQDSGCRVDKSTGFHLHVDVTDFSASELANLGVSFLWFETFFDHIMPESRRACNNRFISSNRSQYGGYGTAALNAGIAKIRAAGTESRFKVTHAINPACRCQREGVRSRCQCSGRYFKMNATSVNHQNSIEFRQHSGTIESDKVENWIRMMVQFVDKAKTSRPRPRTVTREWTASQEMHLFFSMFNIPQPVAAYYMERRRAIKRQDGERAAAAAEAARIAALSAAERNAIWQAGASDRAAIAEREAAERAAAAAAMAARIAREIGSLAPALAMVRESLDSRLATANAEYDDSSLPYVVRIRASRLAYRLRNATERVLGQRAERGADSFRAYCEDLVRRRRLPIATWRRASALIPAA